MNNVMSEWYKWSPCGPGTYKTNKAASTMINEFTFVIFKKNEKRIMFYTYPSFDSNIFS